MDKVEIETQSGKCPSYVFRPASGGPWPAVLVFMDGIGIRPAMLAIGERLAKNGYFAVMPDLFWRAGPYEPMDPKAIFSDPEKRKVLMEKYFAVATPANVMSDTRAFLDWIAAQPDAKPGGVGTTGYCMGGLMSLSAAGTYPDRVVAAASYHGGRLATDAPDSPHRLAPKMKARVYVAGATEDASFSPRRASTTASRRTPPSTAGCSPTRRSTTRRRASVIGRRCSRCSTKSSAAPEARVARRLHSDRACSEPSSTT